MEKTMEKRQVFAEKKEGLSVSDLLLIGVLLAAGIVLKFFVGSMFSVGMKPNFIIAMYCLIILLIKPRIKEAFIIGVLAGAVCQFFPGTPYINLFSEPIGAVVAAMIVKIPLNIKKISLSPIVCTFLSTICSGFSFILIMYAIFFTGSNVIPAPLGVFLGIIFGTAIINSIIVQILYMPLKLALKRN